MQQMQSRWLTLIFPYELYKSILKVEPQKEVSEEVKKAEEIEVTLVQY